METWKPFGQFSVGVVDFEYHESSGSVVLSPSEVDPKQHLTGRIYYPCTPKRQWWWRRKSPSISWLPSVHYAYGLSSFLFFRRPKGFLYWIAKQVIFFLAYVFGSLQRLEFRTNAPLARLPARLPVVVFSHGLGGHRAVYAITCSELASQGYVVLAVEHADGSSSCAKLAGGRGWKFYKGRGGEEGQVEKTRHRVEEMKTAAKVLRALQEGAGDAPGLALAGGRLPTSFFEGCLDLRCLASVGHSYGGATTAVLVAEDPSFKCGVCLDPWWAALPPEAACMQRWKTRAPLLVMGSHDWNVPNVQGEVLCGPDRQAKVLRAAKNGGTAGGSMLLIITGSSHNTFADPLALFSEHVGWALRALGLTARLDPVLGIHLVNAAVLNFLSLHLPLTGDQRQLQTWSPSSAHNALDRIAQLDSFTAPQSGRGPLAWLFPGRGLLNAVSDALLNRVLKMGKHGGAKEAPEDIVTGDEVLESTMPSREPAVGPHPHAPGTPFNNGVTAGVTATGEDRFDARQRQALRSQVGGSFADGVRQEHVDQFVALLQEKHVWKCEAHV